MQGKPLFDLGDRVTIGCSDPTEFYQVTGRKVTCEGLVYYQIENFSTWVHESQLWHYHQEYDDPAVVAEFYAAMDVSIKATP